MSSTHRLSRGSVAAVLSLVAHLILFAAEAPWSAPSERERVTPVVLVPLTPEPVEEAEPPTPTPAPPPEPQPTEEAPTRRPLLAAKLPAQPDPTLPTELIPEPTPEPTVEPPPPAPEPPRPPVVIPSPRDAAKRQVARDVPRPPTDQERVEARVVAMLKASLPPRTNDGSPMPELHLDAEGNLIHEDGALQAVIAPDGTVTFGRRRGAGVDGLDGRSPDPGMQEIYDMQTRIPGVPLPMTVFKATPNECAAGPCEDSAGLGVSVRPHSDLNDLFLRAKGDDPLAARKRRFLRLTRPLRDKLLAEHRALSLKRSKLKAGRHLERVWADGSLSFAQKRRALFGLWDEAEEPAGPDDDREEAKAGLRARQHILRFVRQKLPSGSPEAYGAEELQRLNSSRSSQEPFEPY